MTGRHLLFTSLILSAACFAATQAGSAPGALTQSWRTPDGWLTELRVHPNGARVCSTGKVSQDPHQFVLTFIRSGPEAVVLLVDQQQPPATNDAGDMTFSQAGQTIGNVKTMVEGPAWSSTDPNGAQARDLMSKLTDQSLTIKVDGRQYQTQLTGLGDALAQLSRCNSGQAS